MKSFSPAIFFLFTSTVFGQIPEGRWSGPGILQPGIERCGGNASYDLTITAGQIKGRAFATGTNSSIEGAVTSDKDLMLIMKEWEFNGLAAVYVDGRITFTQNGRRCKYIATLDKAN